MISITLNFTDLAEAAATLGRLAGTPAANTIAHDDRPDVGAPPAPMLTIVPAAPPALDPATVFGSAAAPAAPTVPAPSLPTAATVPTVAPSSGTPERDASGIVWDARIHASTKTKKADGTWTAKRNVEDALRATVEAELRGLPAPVAPVAPPVAPPAAAPAAPAAPAGNAHLSSFAAYMAHVGSVFTNRPLDAFQKMTQALTPHGMQNVGQLAGRPDLIPVVDAEFQRLMEAV